MDMGDHTVGVLFAGTVADQNKIDPALVEAGGGDPIEGRRRIGHRSHLIPRQAKKKRGISCGLDVVIHHQNVFAVHPFSRLLAAEEVSARGRL